MLIFVPQNQQLMTPEERLSKQKDLIEILGRTYDKQGFGLIPGRIMGLFMVMDKELYTFDEIVEELQISKSTASNALRILEARRQIEYTTIAGDRKRYFHIHRVDKFSVIEDHYQRLRTSRDFLQSILDIKADPQSPNALFIGDLVNLISFFLNKFDELKEEYLRQ